MRTVWAGDTRIRSGLASTPRGSAEAPTAWTGNPASRLASARSRAGVGSAMLSSLPRSLVNTPVSTSSEMTVSSCVAWLLSSEMTWKRSLRNWARKPAAAALPPGVATSTVSTTAATSAATAVRVLALSLARRARRGGAITAGGSPAAGVAASPAVAMALVAVRVASRRARRCSRRASAASAAAGGSGASGPVIAIAGAASSALRRSSASVSRQAAQPCTWSCSGAGVPPGTSSRDVRSAPRSGQGIVGSRIGVVIGEIGVTECPLPTGEQHPDRADSQVQGCGDLGVGEAGVAQQQTGALPLRQGGERPAHGPLLLGAEHVQQRAAALVNLVVHPFQPAGAIQPRRGATLAPQPVVACVQAHSAQPRRDLLVRPGSHRPLLARFAGQAFSPCPTPHAASLLHRTRTRRSRPLSFRLTPSGWWPGTVGTRTVRNVRAGRFRAGNDGRYTIEPCDDRHGPTGGRRRTACCLQRIAIPAWSASPSDVSASRPPPTSHEHWRRPGPWPGGARARRGQAGPARASALLRRRGSSRARANGARRRPGDAAARRRHALVARPARRRHASAPPPRAATRPAAGRGHADDPFRRQRRHAPGPVVRGAACAGLRRAAVAVRLNGSRSAAGTRDLAADVAALDHAGRTL